MGSLARTYRQQGRWEEAEKLEVEVVEKRKEALGEGHPSTLTSINNLAVTLRAMGRRQSALNLISSCAEMSKAGLGIDHPDTIAALSIKVRWEAEDTEDDISDVWVDSSAEDEDEDEDDNDECNDDDDDGDDNDDEAAGEETDRGAKPLYTKSLNNNLRDSTEDSNMWNQPQFLWML
ncbi:hypothetical protein MBLNU13_g02060t1 [Cladosporium sp. NU13]